MQNQQKQISLLANETVSRCERNEAIHLDRHAQKARSRRRIIHKIYLTITLVFINSTTFAVNCTITTTPIGFGNYDVFSSNHLDTTGTVRVKCTPGNTQYTVELNAGQNGSIANRRMQQTNGNDKLNYNLYIDAARSTIWGDGTSSSATVTGNNPNVITAYGRVQAGQNVSVGSYSDSVTVTVSF